MKVIPLAKATQEEREDAESEAKLLSYLDHENIISYVEAFEQNGRLCILTEYCDGGDMGAVLEKQNGVPLPENRIVQWLKQICCGLQVRHQAELSALTMVDYFLILLHDIFPKRHLVSVSY